MEGSAARRRRERARLAEQPVVCNGFVVLKLARIITRLVVPLLHRRPPSAAADRRIHNNCSWRDTYPDAYDRMAAEYACDMPNWAETATVLEGSRLAGHSYKQWVLGPYKKLLRLRSQVARGYATIGRGKPPVVARLFGLPGVPDPCFWLVVEYAWLGDWRRP